MIDAVLYERLKDELDRCSSKQLFIEVIVHMELIPEAYFLNRDIVFHQVDLLLDKNNPLALI
ncbi:hypothetical protein D3C77_456130 [compost metagenome]